ncbi:M1 family aminopeptidase [Anaerosphaera multitolerans]|uniref:Peptidase M1 membrane alanine aminopeptidase domain-containing protein n=1 Tax=Anaerosphaera multitolerans TaxID=2487351 RepID=A0A437S5X0_9FIRM|nr:M1 family aminopeptidase [Anaerosphaera multitolerans]RVU54399.1 hypothetical protein EF514_07325 [Anaerosphaera multitolerans]
MDFRKRVRMEILRLLRSKIMKLVIMLTLICPILGYSLYQPATYGTTSSVVLANPVLAGGLGGAFVFGMYTLYEWSRDEKARVKVLADSIINPLFNSGVKIVSLICLAFLTTVLTAIVYLPYTAVKLGIQFSVLEYILSYGLLMFLTVVMGILASASIYQIVTRAELSFIIFLLLILYSLSPWVEERYMLRWINPLIPIYSDNFGNTLLFRTSVYSRIFWISLLLGLYFVSLLSVRVYEKTIFASIRKNIKNKWLLTFSITFITTAFLMYTNQPYVDQAKVELEENYFSGGDIAVATSNKEESKGNKNLKLINTFFNISLNTLKGKTVGKAIYSIVNESQDSQECIINLSPGIKIDSIIVNGKEIEFIDLKNDYGYGNRDIITELPKDKNINMEIKYGGTVKIPAPVEGLLLGGEITSDYIYISGNELAPKLLILSDEINPIEGNITIPSNMTPVSIGKPVALLSKNMDGTNTWEVFNESGGMNFFAADYECMEIGNEFFPVNFYYSKKHSEKFENWNVEEILKSTIEYCTKTYGKLPYSKELPLNLVMNSAHFQGGGATDNLSFITESSFIEEVLNDPLKGANASEVIAHEIIHQWWGVHRFMMDMENPEWTSEGVTVYATYRMMKEKYGEEYVKKNYIDVWERELKNTNDNFYLRNPKYLTQLPERYLYNLQMEFISMNIYTKVPLQILKAEELVGGEEEMDRILKDLFSKEDTEMHPYITWQDFLDACGLIESQLNL